jgi:hypothetical protein
MGGRLQFESAKEPLPMNLRLGYAFTFDFDEHNSLTVANDFNKSLVDRDGRDGTPFYKSLFTSWQPARGEEVEGQASTLSVVEQFTMGVGAEYWYSDLFALRTGYFYEDPENGNREFLNFGAGLRYNIVGVDMSYLYTLEENSPLANTLRFSLLFEFQK